MSCLLCILVLLFISYYYFFCVVNQAALLDGLPETVVTILQDAIESGNRGLLNWLFSHQSVRLISLMSLPCLLPADMVYATVLKCLETAPKLSYNLKTLSEACIQLFAQTLTRHFSPNSYSAKLTCQLAFTEYREGKYFTLKQRKFSYYNTP